MNLTNKDKIKLINKYYRKRDMLMNFFIESRDINLYIVLNYNKKSDTYRLSWFELSSIDSKNIENYLSCVLIPNHIIEYMFNDIAKYDIDLNKFHSEDKGSINIYFESNVKTAVNDYVSIKFKDYFPEEMDTMFSIFYALFRLIPPVYQDIFNRIFEGYIPFNIEEDNIDDIFDDNIILEGNKYYEEEHIKFLERIGNQIFSVTDDKHISIIDVHEDGEVEELLCSCSSKINCKHLYAALKAYQNKEFKNFYKISHIEKEEELVDRLFSLNFALCIGIVDSYYEVISVEGSIERVPIIDENGDMNWTILEDSKDHELEQELNSFLANK